MSYRVVFYYRDNTQRFYDIPTNVLTELFDLAEKRDNESDRDMVSITSRYGVEQGWFNFELVPLYDY